MSRVVVRKPVQRFRAGSFSSRPDSVAGEEPLEIRLDGTPLTITMRTPGNDIELAHGFLHAEGLIEHADDVLAMRYCDGKDDEGANTYNVLDVALTREVSLRNGQSGAGAGRNFITNSSCGVCGKASIEALAVKIRYQAPPDSPLFTPEILMSLPAALRSRQPSFAATGGVHAAALASADGRVELVREDVGRHNAVDKVLGAALMAGRIPLRDRALLTSSRASFELVQKTLMAGIGMLVAVSAPSSLAVDLATDQGMTLIGFTKDSGFNLYAGSARIDGST